MSLDSRVKQITERYRREIMANGNELFFFKEPRKMYIPKHFQAQELLSKKCYEKYGPDFSLFDTQLLMTIDAIKEYFAADMIINTWHMSRPAQAKYGYFSERGYRLFGCGVGSTTGAHYKGQAVDFDLWRGVRRVDPKEITDTLIANKSRFPAVRGIEVASWVHVDVMDRPGQQDFKICVFSPKGFIRWA